MPDSITIPRSINAAERKLNELGEIATATEWQRAAIVAAYVRVRPRAGRPAAEEMPDPGHLETPAVFAARRIHGLLSETTVAIYVRAWLDITDDDGNVIGHRERPAPGRRVTLPDARWPPTRTGTDGYESEVGADRTIDRVIERHGAERVAERVAETAPEATAAAVERVPAARLAGARQRLSTTISPAERRRLQERARQRHDRMEEARDSAMTNLEHSGLVDHEATLRVRTARSWLRKAAAEYERNPLMTEEQRAETDLALAECSHLIALLQGETGQWTETDRDFMRALGIEDEEVQR